MCLADALAVSYNQPESQLAKRPVRDQKSKRPSYSVEDDTPAYYDPRNVSQFKKKTEPLQAQTEAQGQYDKLDKALSALKAKFA